MKINYISTMLTSIILLTGCGGGEGEDVQETASTNQSSEMVMEAHNHNDENDGMSHASLDLMEGEEVLYYTCPMESHKHIQSHEQGKCPECGMELVAAIATDSEHKAFYGCPMPEHSHVRSDTPGRCPECKMELKPIRLESNSDI